MHPFLSFLHHQVPFPVTYLCRSSTAKDKFFIIFPISTHSLLYTFSFFKTLQKYLLIITLLSMDFL